MPLPPGPPDPPIVQTARWFASPFGYLEDNVRRYGDIFTARFYRFGTIVVLSSPAAIKQVFTGDPDVLHAGEGNQIVQPLLGDKSLLLLDGAAHLRERRLLLPPFHGERMGAYANVMRDLADVSLDDWPIGEPFAVHARMQQITLKVILRTVFGLDDKSRLGSQIAHMMDVLTHPARFIPVLLGLNLFELAPWLPSTRLKREVDAALYQEIDRRRRHPLEGSQDILSLLLAARHEDGQPMTDTELRDELMTLLVAGHETTATALAWAFERLAKNPEAATRLEDELGRAIGDGPVDPDALGGLEYLDAVVKETLRLRPIVPLVARRLKRPMEIGGFALPAEVIVEPCIYLVHRRPDLYPEPDRFKPERFVGKKPDPYEWLPFGGGTRRCLGMAFALYEMRVVLATILSRARLRPIDDRPAKPVRRGVTFAPEGGARLILERRAPRRKPVSRPRTSGPTVVETGSTTANL
jgi:cytochrome P450